MAQTADLCGRVLIIGVLALIYSGLVNVPVQAETVCPSDPSSLGAVLQSHGDAIRRADMTAIVADFATGARIVGPGVDLRGKAAIRRSSEEALATYEMAPNNSVDSIEIFDDWGLLDGTFNETSRNRETGEETGTSGTYLTLDRCNEATGTWQFYRVMWQ